MGGVQEGFRKALGDVYSYIGFVIEMFFAGTT